MPVFTRRRFSKPSVRSIPAAFSVGWSASPDITKPGTEEILANAAKSGAAGLGDLKCHVDAAGPELRRL